MPSVTRWNRGDPYPKDWPSWLRKADIEWCKFTVKSGEVHWEDGIWNDGIWYYGTWKGGIWRRGAWVKGIWEGGIWVKGTWEDGIWRRGTWEDRVWEGGTWEDGVWHGGTWKTGTWKGGSQRAPRSSSRVGGLSHRVRPTPQLFCGGSHLSLQEARRLLRADSVEGVPPDQLGFWKRILRAHLETVEEALRGSVEGATFWETLDA